jgi:hypothetical protein
MNPIEFHPNGRGTWKGRYFNGEETTFFKQIFMSEGECERFAAKLKLRALFVRH